MPTAANFSKAEGARTFTALEEKQWVHRIANEMKANRQWSTKWNFLTDPTLFIDEKGPKYPQKLENTSWSEWSVLNPPDPLVIINKQRPKPTAHFKITGNRDRFLSNNKPSATHLPQEPAGRISYQSSRPKPVFKSNRVCPLTSNGEYGYAWAGKLEIFSTSRQR